MMPLAASLARTLGEGWVKQRREASSPLTTNFFLSEILKDQR